MKYLVCFFFLLFSSLSFAQVNGAVLNSISSSFKVMIPKARTSGSGVAIFQRDDKTLIMTNDHVCQATRGHLFWTSEIDESEKLGRFNIVVRSSKGRVYKAKIVKTSGVSLASSNPGPDLCILEIKADFPYTKLANTRIGEKVYSVSAPTGVFPMVHEGYIGPYQYDDELERVGTVTLGVTKGSSGGGIFNYKGQVVGIIFAIMPIHEDTPGALFTYYVPAQEAYRFLKSTLEQD